MKKKDPKVGTGKKPKEQEGDSTQMKTPKIQSLLNLPLWQMPKQLLVRLSVLISRMLGRFKSYCGGAKSQSRRETKASRNRKKSKQELRAKHEAKKGATKKND